MAADGYHHGSLHEAILKAAVREARRVGPQGIQVRALAGSVGVSASAVYRHVPSLDALLAEVAQVARQQLAAHMAEARDRAPARRAIQARARERFRAVGRAYVTFACKEPHLFDTAFTPTASTPPQPDDPSAWQVLIEGVGELIDAGLVPAAAAERAALIAWAGVHGIASILVRGATITEVDTDDAITVVLDAIARSLETL